MRYSLFNSTLHELYKTGQRANGSILMSSEGNETFTLKKKPFVFFFFFFSGCAGSLLQHAGSALWHVGLLL